MRRTRSRKRRAGGIGRGANDDHHDTVSWLGGAAPIDGDTRLVYEAVVKADLTQYGDVVQYVADSLFAEDDAQSGPTAGIAIFRPWYHRLAREILHRLDGSAIAIDRENPAVAPRG